MTREETINILTSIQAAYPNFKVPDKTIAVNTWYSLLEEYTYEQVNSAVKRYIQTNKSGFAPGIGQIIDQICAMYSDDNENEMEAWLLVQKAMKNSGYHADEEFAKLPKIVQKSVVSPGQLKEWALTENLNIEVVSSNFMRTYRLEIEREKELRRTNPMALQGLPKNEPLNRLTVAEERIETTKNAVQMPERAKEKLQSIFYNQT